ncbi:MAG TPA: DUF481 domain-containing protein [Roseimicrobium sp.]|nr:DUF481 domain-containing protein [Roseimicrobium sp.]
MRHFTARWFCVVIFGVASLRGLTAADAPRNTHRLQLPNGEVLVGEVVAEEDAVIVFRSQTWGELRVPKAGTHLDVIAATSAEPVAQAPGWVKVQPAPAPVSAPAPVVTPGPAPAAAVPPPPAVKWKKSIEAGYTYQSRGNLVSTNSTYARGEVSRETSTGLASLSACYLYGDQNSVRNTDKLDVNFKVREQFRGRLDTRNDLSYSYDYLKDVAHQFQDVLGLSYTIFKTERMRYSIGPGIAVQYAQAAQGDTGVRVLGNVSHEFFWQIVDRVTFQNNTAYLCSFQDTRDYRLQSSSVLSGQITEHVSVNLRYEYEFEAILPVASGRSDHRVFTTLGYTF